MLAVVRSVPDRTTGRFRGDSTVTSTLARRGERTQHRRLSLVLVCLLVVAAVAGGLWYRLRPGWQLGGSDDCSGSRRDTAKWQVEDHSPFGDGNHELACLMNRPANVQVAGGQLSL